MNAPRFQAITDSFAGLSVAIIGDFCLDRYLEIDPVRAETSIETGLPVHNVIHVRSQPGAAGTILNNLVALGVKRVFPVGFCGDDGEGFELRRALGAHAGVRLDYFVQTPDRRTFTYCKPLVIEAGKAPRELNRLDSKNWSPTPLSVRAHLADAVRNVAREVDAFILMDQVEVADTGVITPEILGAVRSIVDRGAPRFAIADSRRSLRGYPPVALKMNAAELAAMTDTPVSAGIEQVRPVAALLARQHGRPVFITLAERGILGATPEGTVEHVPALPVRGDIDVVGAGDAVTANLTAALASGATMREALELAMAAASVVVHQLGTTGTASVDQLRSVVAA